MMTVVKVNTTPNDFARALGLHAGGSMPWTPNNEKKKLTKSKVKVMPTSLKKASKSAQDFSFSAQPRYLKPRYLSQLSPQSPFIRISRSQLSLGT